MADAKEDLETHIDPRVESVEDHITEVEEYRQSNQIEQSQEEQLKPDDPSATLKPQHALDQLDEEDRTISHSVPDQDLPVDQPDGHAFELAGAGERLAHKKMKLRENEVEEVGGSQGDASNDQHNHDMDPGKDDDEKRCDMHEDLKMLGVVGLEARKARDVHGMVRK